MAIADLLLDRVWMRDDCRTYDRDGTWPALVGEEPRLAPIMAEALAIRGRDAWTCPIRWLSGNFGERPSLRRRLEPLVGEVVSPPFSTAVDRIVSAFRGCLHCVRAGRRTEYGIELARARQLLAVGEGVQRQVRLQCGIADIVTDGAVFEVKTWLDRGSVLKAIGQVTVYAADLGGDRRRVIIGQEHADTAKLLPVVRRAGIEVEVW